MDRSEKTSEKLSMLPAYPWDARPDDAPLTAEEVCAALYEANGNVLRAADRLKVGSIPLRKFIARSPRAQTLQREIRQSWVDRAEQNLHEALQSENLTDRAWATRHALASPNARGRGWANDPSQSTNTINNVVQNNVTLQPNAGAWLDNTTFGPPPARLPAPIELAPAPTPDE
jgi:hypothetical protein